MICSHCTEQVEELPLCPSCGEDPLLDGRYRLESVVGHGAQGTTYRAARLSDGKIVAIKELLVRKVESLKAIELFERETNVLEQLDHPGIPAYLDELSVDAGRSVALYLVQEFVDGETLATEFEDRRATPAEVFQIAADILDTLAYMHRLSPPVIHRDIKPGNVMRKADGRLVLIDFGAVRDAVDTAEGGSTVAGTFGYMAPEQFMGRAIPATDIYAVGATIVALMTRDDPQKLTGPDRTLDWKPAFDLDPTFTWILDRMLDPDPEVRASDAAQLAAEIRAAVRGELAAPDQPAPRSDGGRAEPRRLVVDVPPAPRELPNGFAGRYVPYVKFGCMFGGIFALTGLIAGIVPMAAAFANGELMPGLLGPLFLFIFGGIGVVSLLRAKRMLEKAKKAYIHGVPGKAVICDVGKSSYAVNGKHANVYEYEFEVDGFVYTGSYESWDDLDLIYGDEVPVLFVQGEPAVNVFWQPENYATRRRRRVSEQRSSNVVFDFSESDDSSAEPAEVAEEASAGGDWN